MNFSRKKLPQEASAKMQSRAVDSIRVGALMPAPAYVYMKLNEKFVAVKAPLDFFTTAELAHIRPFEVIYFPDFIKSVQPFIETARVVSASFNSRLDLSWHGKSGGGNRNVDGDEEALQPASYEIADEVLRAIAPLWSSSNEIEPFFVAIFADELCGPLPEELLLSARERSVEVFESAVLGSSWAVFLALHLGYCDSDFLGEVRQQVFGQVANGKESANEFSPVGELLQLTKDFLAAPRSHSIKSELLSVLRGRAAAKVRARLQRIQDERMIRAGSVAPTIYGEEGFVDG